MATKTLVQVLSDLSGSEDATHLNFAFDGVNYEIDLTEKEVESFRKKLQPYRDAGRRVGGRRGSGSAPRRNGQNTKAIREWARGQGLSVTDRGRIPNDIVAKYEAAH